MEECLKLASEITKETDKSGAYREISKVLMVQRKEKESLKVASQITVDRVKVWSYKDISEILIGQGKRRDP